MSTIILDDADNSYANAEPGIITDGETIFAGAGNDSIFSSIGDDIIYGGSGNDTISSNAANFFSAGDLVYGGEGDDVITTDMPGGNVSSVADTVFGGAGNDSITGSVGGPISGFEVLYAGTGNDQVDGNGGGDFIDLGEGDDFVINREDKDTIDGGSGVDTIAFTEDYRGVRIDLNSGVSNAENLKGEEESEDITGFENVIATNGDDTLLGTNGANTLFGLNGDDRLDGRDGADILIPGTGGNSITGGEGSNDFDILDYRGLPLGVSVTFTGNERGNVTGGDGAPDTFEQIEFLELTFRDDFVDARLSGVGVAVNLHGGDDVVRPGPGADSFFGGDGLDLVNLVGSAQAVKVDNETGSGTGGVAEGDVYDSFESFVLTNFADEFNGSDADETIAGASGADLIRGGGGEDTLLGDSGEDTLDGGEGDDSINGGNGIDTVSFAAAEVPGFEFSGVSLGYVVDLAKTGPQDTGAGIDTIFDVENAEGSDFADLLTGSNEINVLYGGGGGDLLFGGASNDTLFGGAGFDAIEGGLGADVLYGGTTGGGAVEADLATYFQASGALEFVFGKSISELDESSSRELRGDVIGDDIEGIAGADGFSNTFRADEITETTFFLGGKQSDTFFGGSGTDQLLGVAGDDVMYGNDGRDALIGEGGDDDLYGGTGADFFFFDGGNEGNDTIHDMEVGVDVVFFTGPFVAGKAELSFASVNSGGVPGTEDTLITYGTGSDINTITLIDVDRAAAETNVLFAF